VVKRAVQKPFIIRDCALLLYPSFSMDESERRAVIERSRHRIRFLASSRLARFWHHCEPTYKLVRAFQDKGPTNDRIATIRCLESPSLPPFVRIIGLRESDRAAVLAVSRIS